MGTCSHVGMTMSDGTVQAVYIHWDGYPNGVGAILLEHYIDPEKIKALINLGSLSCLGPELGEKHKFEEHNDQWCTAYHRDRDEELMVDTHKNVDQYLCGKSDSCGGGKWCYLWDGTQWLGSREDGDTFVPVAELIQRREAEDKAS